MKGQHATTNKFSHGLQLHLVHQWQELAFDVPSRVRSGGCDDLCVPRCFEACVYFITYTNMRVYIYIYMYIRTRYITRCVRNLLRQLLRLKLFQCLPMGRVRVVHIFPKCTSQQDKGISSGKLTHYHGKSPF